MEEFKQIKKRLGRFGLSIRQADIYILLIRHGNLRVSDIVRMLDIPRSSVYEVLRGLLELGLAEEIVENSYKVIQAYPIGSIRHLLDEKISALRQQTNELDSLEKALKILPTIKPSHHTSIRYYSGQGGARQLFWNSLKAKGIIYVQSEWGRGRYVGIEFYKRFVEESHARNIREQVLTNSSSRVLDSISQHTGTTISRANLNLIRCFSDKDLPFKGDTLIYDNIYAHIQLKGQEINGFEIQGSEFVTTQRFIFEKLWFSAQPINQLLNTE